MDGRRDSKEGEGMGDQVRDGNRWRERAGERGKGEEKVGGVRVGRERRSRKKGGMGQRCTLGGI